MSILSGYDAYKKHIKTANGYKVVSQWTHPNTVEFDDGNSLLDKYGTTSIASIGDGSITGAISTLNSNKADLVNGTVPVAQLPKVVFDEMVTVANDTARFALTTATVQNGDTVYVTATSKMYLVIDDTQLSSENGYQQYAASVTWSTISGKPSNITLFEDISEPSGSAISPVLRQSDLVTSISSSSTTKPLAAYAGYTLNNKITPLISDFSSTYSTTKSYAIGDYCVRSSTNPTLYKCTTAIPSGESWNSSHWQQVNVGDELVTINSEIGDTSISTIGDGTLTGAVSSLNSTLNNFKIETLFEGNVYQVGSITLNKPIKYGDILIFNNIAFSSAGYLTQNFIIFNETSTNNYIQYPVWGDSSQFARYRFSPANNSTTLNLVEVSNGATNNKLVKIQRIRTS